MAQLRQDHQKFIEAGVEILVVGPEGPAAFRSYWEKHDLPFRGLPDPNHTILKRFGQEVNLFKLGRMPAQLIIDRQGCVRFVHYGAAMHDIPETDQVLEIVAGLNREESGERLGSPAIDHAPNQP